MPSRPLKDPCAKCGYRNPVRGKFCAGCGSELKVVENTEMDDKNLHRDVAHPITQEMRDYIHNKVIDAYKVETGKSPSESVASPSADKPLVREKNVEKKEPEAKKGLFGRPARQILAGGKSKPKKEAKE